VKHLVLQGVSVSAAKAQLESAGEQEDEPVLEAPVASAKELSPEQEQIRELEKRVKALESVVREREAGIRRLEEDLAKAKRIKHTISDTGTPVEKRMHSLQAHVSNLKVAEEILDKVNSGALLYVPVYPRHHDGLTLVQHVPENMSGLRLAFTSKNNVKTFLEATSVIPADASELTEYHGSHYLQANKLPQLLKPKPKKPDLEKLVLEYRHGRVA
jgi:hypothetical protein